MEIVNFKVTVYGNIFSKSECLWKRNVCQITFVRKILKNASLKMKTVIQKL